MVCCKLYRPNVISATVVKNIMQGYQLMTGNDAVPLYVRGYFKEVKTRELVMSYGNWLAVTKVGYTYITLLVDGTEMLCEITEPFDVKIALDAD